MRKREEKDDLKVLVSVKGHRSGVAVLPLNPFSSISKASLNRGSIK